MVRKLCVALLLCWSTRRRGAGPTARRACGVESVCLPCVTVDRTDTGLGCDHRLVPLIPTPSTVDLENAAARLGFKLAGTPFRTQTSLLCPVTFEGQRGFVKVTNDPEELTGARALEKWAGNGAVRVLARQGNAVVLEYAGLPVRSVIPDDTAATTVLCAVAERLHSHTPEASTGSPRCNAGSPRCSPTPIPGSITSGRSPTGSSVAVTGRCCCTGICTMTMCCTPHGGVGSLSIRRVLPGRGNSITATFSPTRHRTLRSAASTHE